MFHLQADPRIKDLRTFFYNDISGRTLLSGEFDEDTIDAKLKESFHALVIEIINKSNGLNSSLVLSDGFVLHKGECPLVYLQFFNALMTIKDLPENQRDVAVLKLTNALLTAPGFAEMMPKLRDFLLGKIESKTLKDYFYASLVELALEEKNINENNIDDKVKTLVITLIAEIIAKSNGHGDIIIFGKEKINEENCPRNYLDFYRACAKINQSNLNFNHPGVLQSVHNLATALMNSHAFMLMLPKVKQFILETAVPSQQDNIVQQVPAPAVQIIAQQVPQLAPVPADQIINIETIRSTFYKSMKVQILDALQKGLITTDDLESQESFLYMGLPALALLKVIGDSWDCKIGLRLANGAVVDKNNCPNEESFREFLNTLLLCKERIKLIYKEDKLPENDYSKVQYHCLGQSVPADLAVENAVGASNCAAIINTVASKISQNANFKKMVGTVIEEALQEYKPGLSM